MIECINRKKVKIGNKEYIYNKDENGREYLSIDEKIDNRNVKIILKGSNQKTIKDVEKLVLDVLGGQYIQRNLEKLI